MSNFFKDVFLCVICSMAITRTTGFIYKTICEYRETRAKNAEIKFWFKTDEKQRRWRYLKPNYVPTPCSVRLEALYWYNIHCKLVEANSDKLVLSENDLNKTKIVLTICN